MKYCPICSCLLPDNRSNRIYCSHECYMEQKRSNSKEKYHKKEQELIKSKILANDVICNSLYKGNTEPVLTNFDQLNALGFDFSSFASIEKDEKGHRLKLTSTSLRLIDEKTIQIQLS